MDVYPTRHRASCHSWTTRKLDTFFPIDQWPHTLRISVDCILFDEMWLVRPMCCGRRRRMRSQLGKIKLLAALFRIRARRHLLPNRPNDECSKHCKFGFLITSYHGRLPMSSHLQNADTISAAIAMRHVKLCDRWRNGNLRLKLQSNRSVSNKQK